MLTRWHRGVPHVRGDEPGAGIYAPFSKVVFPTCVGMNRRNEHYSQRRGGVPHVRGDEP